MTVIDMYRRYVPRSLHRLISGPRAALRSRIEREMELPRIPNRRTLSGAIWGISIMRDEADIAGHTARHLLEQGVDGLIIADNCSRDGTRDAIRDATTGHAVYLCQDAEPGHFQAEKMSYLAYLAWRAGAEWIVPFDADEHWYAPGVGLAEYLRHSVSGVVRAMMHDVRPLSADDCLDFADESFVRVCVTLPPSAVIQESQKVAFRARSGTHILSGNHEIARVDTREDGLHLLHYKWRSPEQYFRKVRQGAAAMRLANSDRSQGWHWRERDDLDDDALRRSWVELFSDFEGADGACWEAVSAPWVRWRAWPFDD